MSHPFAPFMQTAVRLAQQGRWTVHPNPMVGAVLVRHGEIVAQGWHTAYGHSHAERACLDDAHTKGIDPTACTLVVTLEPCNHHGKTPPCSQAIVQAGIRHVVIGTHDPHHIAAGGMEYLQEHGVTIEYGIEEQLCRDLIADFIIHQSTQRPYIFLKLAATLDGRIATRTGHSRWVSGEHSRECVQALRAGVGACGGAILIGGGTFREDNPHLTVRQQNITQGTPRHPLACIVTSRLPQSPNTHYLLKERPMETLFLTPPAVAASPAAQILRQNGVRIWDVLSPSGQNTLDFEHIFIRMRQELHCPYILCEGGGKLALSLLEAGIVDEFRLHLAPRILGDNASLPIFDGRAPLQITEALHMRITQHELCGEDLHITLRPILPLHHQES